MESSLGESGRVKETQVFSGVSRSESLDPVRVLGPEMKKGRAPNRARPCILLSVPPFDPDEICQNPNGTEQARRLCRRPVRASDSGQIHLHTCTGSLAAVFRKEVIQPQVLLRLPCYDFTPIMSHTLGACPLAVGLATSSTAHFRDVTGGVYKARERIHGADLIRHY